jgi:hypothetical protein
MVEVEYHVEHLTKLLEEVEVELVVQVLHRQQIMQDQEEQVEQIQ